MSRALGHSVLPLPCENRRISMGGFVTIIVPSSCIPTVYMGLSTGVYFFGTTTYVGKTGGLFLLVVQDPISRARHLSAPPKSHCVDSYERMYSHLSLIPQPSRTLGTNARRRASVDSHGSNALHCCTSSSCSTCPTIPGAHATNLESRIFLFPSRQQALAHLRTV